MTANPDAAVREALEPNDALDVLEQLESDIDGEALCAATIRQHIAALTARVAELTRQRGEWIAANGPGGWIDDLRLAALAGAGPVAWCDPSDPRNSHAFSWPGTAQNPAHTAPLFPHAPAKAREVTSDDVERACIAHYEDWIRFHQHEREAFRKTMRAALVTFAEGATG